MYPDDLVGAAEALSEKARANGVMLATAESCTGGLVAALLTEIPGSSDIFDRGFVTYTLSAKTQILGVPKALLKTEGSVSEATARAMAAGAIANSNAQIAVAITGVAGPGGGSAEKPVGLVHFAACRVGGKVIARKMEYGALGRSKVRLASVATALELMDALL